ncbi:MAG: transposase [Ferruginibacter sp.]
MSTKYKFVDNTAVYFTTSTVTGWTDVFTRQEYKTILLDSIRHCQQKQGLVIHAWILMTNHLHTICSCKEGQDLGLIWRNIKSFTATQITNAILNNAKESRKENLVYVFESAGKASSSNTKYKFWEHENHPVLLETTSMYNQTLNYLHWNPVTAGFVEEPWYWLYSSATDYFTNKKGLLDIVILDGF